MTSALGPLALGIAMLLSLAACESSVDRQRATICRRVVPALAPPDTAIRLLRVGSDVGSGAGPDALRVDYAVTGRPGQAARQRWVACGFGPGAELLSLATESGPVSGPNLYLLRHYYLDTPEAVAADPGAGTAPPAREAR